MAREQRYYKVDTKELAQDIALASVTGEDDVIEVILKFCNLYSIPVNAEDVKSHKLVYEQVSKALEAKNKSREQKPKK